MESTRTEPRVSVTLEEDRFVVRMSYSPETVKTIRTLPGAHWNPQRKVWRIPASTAVARGLVKLLSAGGEWRASDEAYARVKALLLRGEERRATSNAQTDEGSPHTLPDGHPLVRRLRAFQRAGVAYALAAKRCLIADEMGLGKTVQAIATVELAGAYPCIVVCPASLKLNWVREWSMWAEGRRVVVVDSGRADIGGAWHSLDPPDVVVINYDLLRKVASTLGRDSRGLPRWSETFPVVEELLSGHPRSVILDESHYVKSGKAKRTKAAVALCDGIEYRLALTGTPVLNRPIELVPQLRALGTFRETFGNLATFTVRYCDPRETPWGTKYDGATNLGELHDRLRESGFVRRLKVDVLEELPEKQRAVLPLPMQPAAMREYREAEADLLEWLRRREGADAAERASYAEALVRMEKLKQLAVRGKLPAALDWIAEFLDSGEKLVVFATHRETVEAVRARFPSVCRTITGETPLTERAESVELFQDRGGPVRLLACNIKAAGVGLTMTAASNVAFLELGWTPAEHDQAEDRVHRIGQRDSVTAWYLLAGGTVDVEIARLLDEKRAVVDQTVDGRMAGTAGASIADDLFAAMGGRAGKSPSIRPRGVAVGNTRRGEYDGKA